jgi:hypothetical protein
MRGGRKAKNIKRYFLNSGLHFPLILQCKYPRWNFRVSQLQDLTREGMVLELRTICCERAILTTFVQWDNHLTCMLGSDRERWVASPVYRPEVS